MISSAPRISVLLPVHNAELYIQESIESILNQTFEDFELIIIDDGSSDQSLNKIKSYNDNRIFLIKNEKNIGIIDSLNKGIEVSRGKYIARMDADDICVHERLALQYDLMENNPDLAVIGSWYKHFPEGLIVKLPADHESLCLMIFDHTPIAHPTAFMRKSFIDKHNIRYNSSYRHAEDFQMWTKVILQGGRLSNLQKVLLNYRIHQQQISSVRKEAQERITSFIRYEYLSGIFNCLSAYPSSLTIKLFNEDKVKGQEFSELIKILSALMKENNDILYFDMTNFKILLQNLYIRLLHRTNSGVHVLKSFIFDYSSLTFLKTRHKIKSLKIGIKWLFISKDL